MDKIKKVALWFAPAPAKSDDGRDQWPSRASFVLASMGGCMGMGNLIRYPSQVYNNNGLQWFVPYLMCIFFIAIPALILEIAVGQAYRGGSVIAFNSMNRRLKGSGLSLLYISFVVGPYFVVNLAWIMVYFRNSFQSPLPWEADPEDFFYNKVVANKDPVPGNIAASGDAFWYEYPGVALIGETVAWTAFTWFLVWLCIFRGVGLTGRVVYWTMGLPIVMTIILIGRGVSLPNAGRGIKLYFAEWHSEKLAGGEIWQTAVGQVFFSTGVGFGYFSSYASYNHKHSNAVMDSFIIVCSNAVFEALAAFAVFGVVGFLNLMPVEGERIGAFTIGFLTLPPAIAEMAGANFWAVLLFFTLMVLGFSSAFAMLDAIVTLIMDMEFKWRSGKLRREWVVTGAVIVSFLLSLPYCTEFGYFLLTGIDRWTSDVALVFVVWTECVASMSIYRWKDVAGQVGKPALFLFNASFIGAQVLGVAVGHAVFADVGAGVGFGIFIIGTAVSLFIAKTPDSIAPRFWGKNAYLSKLWYLMFYSGNQLRRDLNCVVAEGKNWGIPIFWAPFVRFVSSPILAIVYGFSYPAFYDLRNDPLHVLGFGVAHLALVMIGLGFLVPRWFDVFIPGPRRNDGRYPYAPNVTLGAASVDAENSESMEDATSSTVGHVDSAENEKKTAL